MSTLSSPRPGGSYALVRATVLVALLFAFFLPALPASAQTTLSSSAFGESIDLRLLRLLGGGIRIVSPPQAFVSGSAPPAFDKTASAFSASLSTPLTGTVLSTGLLIAHAASTGPAAGGTVADATVHNVQLNVLGSLLPLLKLSADQIRSSAAFSGSCSSGLAPSGSSELTHVTLGGSLGVGLTVSASTPPNTVLLNAAGVKVIVNEQIVSTSGDTTTLTVNAIHIKVNGALSALGLLSGDIFLAQSRAQSRCSQEPQEADLSAAASAPPNVILPETFLAEASFTNNGPDPVASAQLTISLEGPGELVAEPAGCVQTGQTLTCTAAGPFANGDSWIVSFEVATTEGGAITITASVSGDLPDPDLTNNSAAAVVEVFALPEL